MKMEERDTVTVSEPIPISLVSNRYLLHNVNAITYLRRQYRICGVLIGSLPQFPQQNIFLGVPLELMPEEARLLVEKGVATIVDDVDSHAQLLRGLAEEEQKAFLKCLRKEGVQFAKKAEELAVHRREEALRKAKYQSAETWRPPLRGDAVPDDEHLEQVEEISNNGEDSTVFEVPAGPSRMAPPNQAADTDIEPFYITPTTSFPLIQPPTPPRTPTLPGVPSSYPLFAHLHARDYFISPGLRFGCQYLVYPGDPLRFHSHFLAVSHGWEEEFDLIDIVAGGRLGTGVKKGFLVGGVEEPNDEERESSDGVSAASSRVRTFCVEWGGM